MNKNALAVAVASLGFASVAGAANLIVNGGFETPGTLPGPNDYVITDASNVPGWSTTASDNQIEIWNAPFLGVSAANGPTGSLLDGQQYFSEINANMPAEMYQTVMVPVAEPMDFSFLHRGRAGLDTVQFTITYLGADGIFGTGDDAVQFQQQYSADDIDDVGEYAGWNAHAGTGIFTSVAGGEYRVGIEAISTAGGPSVGNFLDNVSFGPSDASAPSVPEPASIGMLGLGAIVPLLARRKRQTI